MSFKIIDDVTDVAIIARGKEIRTLDRLRAKYGTGNWRKMKGKTRVRLANGRVRRVEVHWYEAHGIGKRDWKIKRFLD
jgi:hypothetical protein